MASLTRPSDLSNGAWEIMKAVYKNYEKNDSKELYDLNQFNFSHEDLTKYCKELHDARFVFFEKDGNGETYLYMLFNVLNYVK